MTDTKYTDTDINIEKESTKHIQRNKKEKKTIHNISMAKRNQDIEQLKEFANEVYYVISFRFSSNLVLFNINI